MSNVISINRPMIDRLKEALKILEQCRKTQPDYNAVFIDDKGFYFVDKVRPGTMLRDFTEMPFLESACANPDSAHDTYRKIRFRFYDLVEGVAVFKQDGW